jgi:choline dehydrogenase-like flavoprotein
MYLNADQLPDGTLLRGFDICIVGAGAAGLAMTKRLIGSSANVLVLSSGSASDRGRPASHAQSIYQGTVGPLLAKVDPLFLDRSRLHMYGGTTNHFGFWSRPLDEADFKPRPGYRDAYWPIDRAELAASYRDAHQFGHFGPFNYDDMPFWERVLYARRFPPLPGDPLRGAVMHAQYDESLHDFQVQFGDDLRAAQNITVMFNANLLRVEATDSRAHVTGLSCATIEDGKRGRSFRVEANAYVLAMGGIETVRVLRLSGDLGNNRRDHLGRGFMVHPLIREAARVRFARPVEMEIRNFFRDQQVRLQLSPTESGEYIHVTTPLVNPELIFTYDVFNAWGILVATPEAMQSEQIGNFRLILLFDPAGDEAVVNVNWEQVPNENSVITLNPAQTDPVFGQPVTHLDWRLLDADKRTVIRALDLCRNYLRERGAVDFQVLTDLSGDADRWSFPPDLGELATGDHHMGALRMSSNSGDGIVNRDSRVHSVDNLYIAGCSVFPTSGFANPTLTIVALALRLADHLKATAS